MRLRIFLLAVTVAFFSALNMRSVQAQFVANDPHDNFRDTSMLKPASGSKVSLIVFEDLGCPACAHAHPIEVAAALKYRCPIVRYDFPLKQHIWTFDGAICARYLQDKVSPKLADEYRSAVFLSQNSIASREDLQHFTQRWMQQHGQQMPFVMDPKGELAAKVKSDYELGLRLHVERTPTIVVVTQNRYQMVCGVGDSCDPNQLFPVIEAAVEQTKSLPLPARAPTSIHR
jgi:protein-disulfide isomerase